VPSLEKVRILSDLATLEFSQNQISLLENSLAVAAAEDERIPLLVQVPGIGMLSAITIVAAIGEISRFPEARKLVGYAGLGSRVHDSGQRRTTGGIPKSGRKDLRRAMVDAANHAVRSSAHWKAQFKRLEPRLGRSRAIVAIARKLLVVVWHLLTDEKADRFSEPEQVARLLFSHAYRVGVKNLPGGQSALEFTRDQLDRLGIGEQITELPWGRKRFKLPPSKLPPESQATG
jgi:transposase